MAKRRNFSAQFKAKVALEALRGERTLSDQRQMEFPQRQLEIPTRGIKKRAVAVL